MSLGAVVKEKARELGFDEVGIAGAEPLAETERIVHERIDQGLMAGLPWFTKERATLACQPQRLLPGARSFVALALSYHPGEGPEEPARVEPIGRISSYAAGQDYHEVLGSKLNQLADFADGEAGHHATRRFVDTSPLVERAVAERAGIGWFGKNANLLTRGQGSWVFLGMLATTRELPPDAPLRKSCGACQACLPACPTGAIVAPSVIDNARCISYLTIENKGPIPRDLRPLLGNRIFGCDDCQAVCPVNRRKKAQSSPEFAPQPGLGTHLPLIPLLSLSEEGFRLRFRHTALWRAKRRGLLRNVCVALGNSGDRAAVPALGRALMEDPEPLVRGHAAWALGRLGGGPARAALERARKPEASADVREEIQAALAEAGCVRIASISVSSTVACAGPKS
ncbi:MAG: tRNA epoxyqueuosine(34) reductase QueG [Chloroflexi bacterium]|nr:tRNA epoxyqueuosine(34) reductase QueG [Chloroflexota bacterium]